MKYHKYLFIQRSKSHILIFAHISSYLACYAHCVLPFDNCTFQPTAGIPDTLKKYQTTFMEHTVIMQ